MVNCLKKEQLSQCDICYGKRHAGLLIVIEYTRESEVKCTSQLRMVL